MPHQHRVFPAWQSWVLDNFIRKLGHNPGKIMQGLIKEGDTAADIGCGPGFFTINMARMAGEKGKVIAADLQEKMLDKVRNKAKKKLKTGSIVFVKSDPNSTNIKDKLDFALCFYLVHEVPDNQAFFKEMAGLMKPGGKILFAEPASHVDEGEFKASIENAKKAGFEVVEQRKITGSKAVVLRF